MQLVPIRSKIIRADDDLVAALLDADLKLKEKDILVVSSKVVSMAEGRVAPAEEFDELVRAEAEKHVEGKIVDLTKKFGIWIANSGIDKSNVPAGQIVLWPEDPQKSADELWARLKEEFGLENLGILIVDSICQPGRQGVTAACLAYRGFVGVEDARGEQDLFGNELQITTIAKADQIAAAANLIMGEAAEATPFVLVREAPVQFSSLQVDSVGEQSIPDEDCIFKPLFK